MEGRREEAKLVFSMYVVWYPAQPACHHTIHRGSGESREEMG